MDTFKDDRRAVEADWCYLQTLLPEGWEEAAREAGALERRREVRDPATLLRLCLAYGYCGMSLRSTAAWGEQALGVCLSDVALLKRLRKTGAWLGGLLEGLLAHRAQHPSWKAPRRRVRLADATCVSKPGSRGTDWRIHVGFDLGTWQIDQVHLTDASGGETLTRFAAAPGDIWIADRIYATRTGIGSVVRAEADVVVRMNWQNLPLEGPDGEDWSLLDHLCTLKEAEAGDWQVRTKADSKAGIPPVNGRVVALRKSEQAAEESRAKLRREAAKKGKTLSPVTLETAGYVFVFTTLSQEEFPAPRVLELYRFRWQIEMAFKCMKGVLSLDEMAAKDERLCRTFLFSKLLATLLIQDLSRGGQAFPPLVRESFPRLASFPRLPVGIWSSSGRTITTTRRSTSGGFIRR